MRAGELFLKHRRGGRNLGASPKELSLCQGKGLCGLRPNTHPEIREESEAEFENPQSAPRFRSLGS